jgi:tRNA (adenine37-N6)-methyltransferase
VTTWLQVDLNTMSHFTYQFRDNNMNTKNHESICYKPIGIIYSPFKELKGMPIQPLGAIGVKGGVLVFPEYADGLKDLDGFSHLIILYHCHKCVGYDLLVKPFLDIERRGVFATRSPKRPNSIGLSVVKLTEIKGREIFLENVDILDGTPVLDIKPYVKDFDIWPADRFGWLDEKQQNAQNHKSDGRFEGKSFHENKE